MNPAIKAQAEIAVRQLRTQAEQVGVPGALLGKHIAGPTRGRSVVVVELAGGYKTLPDLLEALLGEVARLEADADGRGFAKKILEAAGLHAFPVSDPSKILQAGFVNLELA